MHAFALADKIQKVWPHLKMASHLQPGHIWIRDLSFYVPPVADADRLIHWRKWWNVWHKPAYVPGRHDCDDFAIRTAYEVQQACNSVYPLAFGICDVTECQYSKSMHSLNIMVCEEEIILYDPQQDAKWFADPGLDSPYFIRI